MTKIILDLDMGIDDALALAYALGSPELELIGITATYGNVLVQDGVRNDLALLELFGRPDIPVFAGESHALAKDGFEVLPISEFIHGTNGIGDVTVPDAAACCQKQSAVDFLIDSVAKYGDDLVIVPTGAMTNIATAMRRSPEFAEHAHIVFMGGALAVPGNVSPCVEANISQDPEAADIMVRHGKDVTMVGLDVTLQTLLTYEETRKWREYGTPAGQLLADATDYYIKAYETTAPELGGCGLHDPPAHQPEGGSGRADQRPHHWGRKPDGRVHNHPGGSRGRCAPISDRVHDPGRESRRRFVICATMLEVSRTGVHNSWETAAHVAASSM